MHTMTCVASRREHENDAVAGKLEVELLRDKEPRIVVNVSSNASMLTI